MSIFFVIHAIEILTGYVFLDKLKVGFASKDCVIKDEDDVKYQLILSPVIKYASNVEFAPRYE